MQTSTPNLYPSKIVNFDVSLIKDSDNELLEPYREGTYPLEEMPEKFNDLLCMLSDESIYSREGIQNLADVIGGAQNSLGKDPFPLFHSFAGGVYTREIHMPRGYGIVGAIHKHENMVYLISGKLLIASEDGLKLLEAPLQFKSKPGTKRIGFIIEDTVWIDIHTSESETIEEAEKELFCDTYEEFEFSNMVKELGFTEKQVSILSQTEIDLIPTPEEYIGNTELKESLIHGMGIFATKDFKKDQVVDCLREGLCRTPVGRYTNHNDNPNAKCVIEDDSLLLIACKNISADSEILVDYRNVRSKAIELDSMMRGLCQQE